MEIGVPSNVRHVVHVTFDRFNGFLGLPVEFEPEVPRRPPSASTSVFGVSTESMQLSFDSRGNSVPTILLMMQQRLYVQEGLQAEGIFRINPENGQEEYVREQLNAGVVPDNIDVHCLAGLIKAWFRELPNGLLDCLLPEEVMQAQSEEECVQLVRRLPPTEAALLDWAINLMSDVAQLEHLNKMTAHNIAMVFAPNMTKMADPLTALMHAVQVMNFLKTLIVKTLREREDSILEFAPLSHIEPPDMNGHPSPLQPIFEEVEEGNEEDQIFVAYEPSLESASHPFHDDPKTEDELKGLLNSIDNTYPVGKQHLLESCPRKVVNKVGILVNKIEESGSSTSSPYEGPPWSTQKKKTGRSNNSNLKNTPERVQARSGVRVGRRLEKSRGTTIVRCLNSRTELLEAWR